MPAKKKSSAKKGAYWKDHYWYKSLVGALKAKPAKAGPKLGSKASRAAAKAADKKARTKAARKKAGVRRRSR